MTDSNENDVWVAIGITKNLGDYNSLRIDAGAKRTGVKEVDREDVWLELWSEVEDEVQNKLKEATEAPT